VADIVHILHLFSEEHHFQHHEPFCRRFISRSLPFGVSLGWLCPGTPTDGTHLAGRLACPPTDTFHGKEIFRTSGSGMENNPGGGELALCLPAPASIGTAKSRVTTPDGVDGFLPRRPWFPRFCAIGGYGGGRPPLAGLGVPRDDRVMSEEIVMGGSLCR
jgi:hypothetical protein